MAKDLIRGESPNSNELKKLKGTLRLLNEWLCQAIQEEREDQEQVGSEYNNHNHTENPKEPESETDEEGVCVERTGECLTIQIKCPCGRGYQILIFGDAC